MLGTNGSLSGTPEQSDEGANVFTVQVDDGNGGTDTATLNVTVDVVNDAPVFVISPINGANASEDVAYSGSVANATDEEGDALSYSKLSGPAWLLLGTDGSLSGTPEQSDAGANVFTVQVDDGNDGIASATLNITVDAVNDAPVFAADPIDEDEAIEAIAYAGSVANATDAEGDSLSYSKLSGPAWLLLGTDGSLSGTPTGSDVGANVFTVEVDDGNGGNATATLNITVIEAGFYFDIVKWGEAGGDMQILTAGANTAGQNSFPAVYSPSLLLNPADGTNGYDVSAVGRTNELSGAFSNSNTTPVFVNNGAGDCMQLVYNGDFTATPFETMVAWDSSKFLVPSNNQLEKLTVEFKERSPSNVPTVSFLVETSSGWYVTDQTDTADTSYKSFVLDAAVATFSGFDKFGLSAGSGQPDLSDIQSVGVFSSTTTTSVGWTGTFLRHIKVVASAVPNQAPSFTSGSINEVNATEDIGYSSTIADDASDPNSDPMTFSKVSGPVWLTVAADGDLSGMPAQSDAGLNVFTVQVDDGNGATTTATLNITVDAVNDAPVFNSDPINQANATEDIAYAGNVANATDAEGDTLSYSKLTGPDWLLVETDGSLSGTPAQSDAGANVFTVQADDGNGGTDTATLNITVDAVNDAPVFAADPINEADAAEDIAYVGSVANATDAEGDTLSYSKLTGPGWLIVASDGSLSGTPDNSNVGLNSWTVQVADGNGGNDATALSINVINVNDSPSASDAGASIAENASAGVAAGTVVASDPDVGDSLSYAITAGNGDGLFSIDNSGKVISTGPLDFETASQHVLTVTVTDSGSLTANATVTIDVTNVNEDPVANDNSGSIAEDSVIGSSVLTVSASDVDAGDSLSYGITAGNTGGEFAIDSNGDITTVSALDFETAAQYVLTVTVTDSGSLTDTATVTIDVTNVNENPVANDNSGSIAEDAVIGSSVLSVSASDVDAGDSLSYGITAGNIGGEFAIDSSGVITTVNGLDFETTAQYVLTVTVTDSGSLTDTATVTIDVTDVVEVTAPVVSTGAATNLEQTSADVSYTINNDGGEAPTVTLYYGETNGGIVSGNWDSSVAQGVKTSGSYVELLSDLTAGTSYYFSVHASNSAGENWGSTGSFTTAADTSPKLVRTTVTAVSNGSWTTVDLGKNYTSAVIVATPIYPNTTTPPVVTRVANVSGSSFDLKIDRADGLTDAMTIDVSVVAVDEGVYTQAVDGVTMEAVKFTSTVTADKTSWVAEAQTYQNSYTAPVVVGQVMSANDSNWSVFWSMGSSRTNPANASNLNVGKHVGEDSNTTRANETIGYIVIESGSGSINGVAYEAALGADTVRGFDNSSSPYTYTLSGGLSTVSAAAASIAGMDGGNGAWAVLSGSPALTTSSIGLHALEDQIGDAELTHTTTQVGYIIFE